MIIAVLPFFASAQKNGVSFTENNSNTKVEFIKIVEFSPFWKDNATSPNVISQDKRVGANNFKLVFEISKPRPLSISILNRTETVFFSPDHIIQFEIIIDNNVPKFIYYGKKSAHYNYFNLIVDEVKKHNISTIYDPLKGLSAYKNSLTEIYNIKLRFLKNFIIENNTSEQFYNYAKQEIENQYIFLLNRPFVNKIVTRDDITDSDYFDLENQVLKDNNYDIEFVNSSSMLTYVYKLIINNEFNYLENFEVILEQIQSKLTGDTREFMLTNLIGVYAKVQNDSYKTSLLNLINETKKTIKDTTRLNYINASEIEYTKLNRVIPDSILTATFLKNIDGSEKISLKELLKNYKDKPIYIDFWASWCVPCREDIASSKDSKEFLESKGVTVLYFSLDTKRNEKAWINASKKDEIEKNQNILIDDFKSALAKYFIVNSIPRYVYLDKSHILKSIDAPRINSSQIKTLKFFINSQ